MTPKERLKQIQETYCPTCRKYQRCRPFMLITMDEWGCLIYNEPFLSDDDPGIVKQAAALPIYTHDAP